MLVILGLFKSMLWDYDEILMIITKTSNISKE